jgi:hypothetical protein
MNLTTITLAPVELDSIGVTSNSPKSVIVELLYQIGGVYNNYPLYRTLDGIFIVQIEQMFHAFNSKHTAHKAVTDYEKDVYNDTCVAHLENYVEFIQG